MTGHVLITGGAGFLGSHLADELLRHGYKVRALDDLSPQVHGAEQARQALSNPYTGVLAIFASRLLNNRPPLLFEDGQQRRDFVSVHDVCQACRLALESDNANFEVLNVGSGREMTVREAARAMAAAVGKPHIDPALTRKYRMGDVRHCFPDIRRARDLLGYEPRVELGAGLVELAGWLKGQAATDRAAAATAELEARGLSL